MYRAHQTWEHRHEVGGLQSSTTLSTMNAPTTAGDKGDWVEMIASSAFDANAFEVMFAPDDGYNRRGLFDVGVGPEDSEIVVAEDLVAEQGRYSIPPLGGHYVPLRIKKGSRVAMRCSMASQFDTAAFDAGIRLMKFGPDFHGYERCQTLGRGAVSGDNRGTKADPGATAHSKGGYTQIGGTTDFRARAIIIAVQRGGQNLTSARYRMDVGIGAPSSEIEIIPDLCFNSYNADGSMFRPDRWGPWPCDIPAGSKLHANLQCSIDTDPNRNAYVFFYLLG